MISGLTMPELGDRAFPLTSLARAARIAVGLFAGLAAFVPSLIWLLTGPPDLLMAGVWGLPFTLWLTGWAHPSWRAKVPTISVAALLLFIVLVPPPSGLAWPDLKMVALAVGVTAAATGTTRWAFTWTSVAIALLAIDYVSDAPHGYHSAATPMDALGVVVITFGVSLSASVLMQEAARASVQCDLATQRLLDQLSEAQVRELSMASQSAVDRAIHGTVLNTLAAVTRGDGNSVDLRPRNREDIRALDSIRIGTGRNLGDILNATKSHVDGPRFAVIGHPHTIEFLDDQVALVAQDALEEVFRNISRHAHAAGVVVEVVKRKAIVDIVVSDDGVGMDTDVQPGFGVRSTLQDAIAGIGGCFEIRSALDEGTSVRLTFPLTESESPNVPLPTAREALLGPPLIRAAILGPVIMGLVLIVPVSSAFRTPALVLMSYLVFASCMIWIAARWDAASAPAWAWVAWILMVICLGLALATLPGCESVVPLGQLLSLTAGAMLLPQLLQPTIFRMAMLVGVAILPLFVLTWGTPVACQPTMTVAAINVAVWMSAVAGIAIVSGVYHRVRENVLELTQQVNHANARSLAWEAAQHRWNIVNDDTRALVNALATGSADARDGDVRQESCLLESRLRCMLETTRITSAELRATMEGFIDDMTACGTCVSLLVVDTPSEGDVPDDIVDVLIAIGRASSASSLQITLLDQEILVTAHTLALVGAGCPIAGETDRPGVSVGILRWESSWDHEAPLGSAQEPAERCRL